MNNSFNSGRFVKILAVILFVALLICGAKILTSGFAHMNEVIDDTHNSFSEFMSYTLVDAAKASWKAKGYAAKTEILNGLYILLSSIATIPLYGFGQLIEDTHSTKNMLASYMAKSADCNADK